MSGGHCFFIPPGNIRKPKVFRKCRMKNLPKTAQPAITCSKLTIKTVEQGVKYVQS